MAVGQKTDLARPQRRLQLVLRLQIRVRVTLYYLQPWKPWLKDRDDSKTLCVTFFASPIFLSAFLQTPLPYLIGSLYRNVYINVTRGQLSSSSFRENKNLPSFEGTSSKDSRLQLYILLSRTILQGKKERNISRNASRVQKHAYFFPTQSFQPYST